MFWSAGPVPQHQFRGTKYDDGPHLECHGKPFRRANLHGPHHNAGHDGTRAGHYRCRAAVVRPCQPDGYAGTRPNRPP